MPEHTKPPVEQQDSGTLPRPGFIVGIGASAGGLEAFETFFSHMPPDSGMAFVLVQHLDPQQPSLLPELLAPHTRMPVRPVANRMPVAPDHVYLIPPNTTLTIDQGSLFLATPAEVHGHRLPIDHFFRSLAADQGNHAVGIVLSGSGADGTLGLLAIKDYGGMTMVQAPESAQYDAMPRSAIARGVVDHVVPIGQMPMQLLAYTQHVANHTAHAAESDGASAETAAGIAAICAILLRATGHDFRHYKPATLLRRIARRMQVAQVGSLDAYVERLRQDRPEVDGLFQDLLISVTSFFRDPAAFDALAGTVIPNLFRNKDADRPVRVWVPGCATGEEAYTLAILLHEHLAQRESPPPVQVFATDIDAPALDVARQGRYAESIAEHVSGERLARFFTKAQHGYQAAKAIRDLCIFSTHNLISDPPFARIDLLSCRNLLIYLDADLQRKLFPLFHYALAPGGYLFLGPSESIAVHPELFRTVDKQHRVFQRSDQLVRPQVDFPLIEPIRRPIRHYGTGSRGAASKEPDVGQILERVLLAQYTPPAVIINEQNQIVYFSGRTGAYLEPSTGAPSLDIRTMAHPDLRAHLQTAIRTARKHRTPAVHANLAIETPGGVQRLNLIVRSLSELGPDSGELLVIFQDIGPALDSAQAHATPELPQTGASLAQQLAQELQITHDALQATIAELEDANTDLGAANEELLSFNEELQSANEEMQTSKEELQSINEELQTVNVELSRKIEELDRANGDLQNLFASTQIPAIFLHGDGRIARFTPAATQVFRLIESDIDRPITDIAPRFRDGDLDALVQKVLRTLVPYEEPVRGTAIDTWWIMRLRPYRTLANVIDGVVITFSDITKLKQVEAEREQLLESVQQARIYAEQIVETVREPLLILDANLCVQAANRAFYETFQVTPAETERMLFYDLGSGQWDNPRTAGAVGRAADPERPFSGRRTDTDVSAPWRPHHAAQCPPDRTNTRSGAAGSAGDRGRHRARAGRRRSATVSRRVRDTGTGAHPRAGRDECGLAVGNRRAQAERADAPTAAAATGDGAGGRAPLYLARTARPDGAKSYGAPAGDQDAAG